jgi:hypothetical protein
MTIKLRTVTGKNDCEYLRTKIGSHYRLTGHCVSALRYSIFPGYRLTLKTCGGLRLRIWLSQNGFEQNIDYDMSVKSITGYASSELGDKKD